MTGFAFSRCVGYSLRRLGRRLSKNCDLQFANTDSIKEIYSIYYFVLIVGRSNAVDGCILVLELSFRVSKVANMFTTLLWVHCLDSTPFYTHTDTSTFHKQIKLTTIGNEEFVIPS